MKKAIKIALIIFLAASMLFVLTGCGKDEKETDVKKKTETEKVESDSNNEESEQEVEESEKEFSMGEWKGNTYENEFLGIKFNLPTGWKYSSDEEIAQMMNVGAELLDDDLKMAAEMAKLTSVYYAVATDPNTGSSVSIMSEKPLMDFSEEYYINQVKTQLGTMESIKYEIGETAKEIVGDKEYSTLTVTTTMSGINFIQKYYVHKMDEYFVCLILTSTNGESVIDTIVESFE